jgi:hypothetical protein
VNRGLTERSYVCERLEIREPLYEAKKVAGHIVRLHTVNDEHDAGYLRTPHATFSTSKGTLQCHCLKMPKYSLRYIVRRGTD